MTNLHLPTGSHSYAPTSPVAAPVASKPTSSTYYLPSGEPVQVADDVAMGAALVSFQLASGKVVNARRAASTVRTCGREVETMERRGREVIRNTYGAVVVLCGKHLVDGLCPDHDGAPIVPSKATLLGHGY